MKRLLIVVDYQNDFVCGSLGFDKAKELEKGILEKIAKYQNDEIIYTLDTHFDDYLTTSEGKSLPFPHCIKGTVGHRLYGGLAGALKGKLCFEKNTFPSLEMAKYLEGKDFDTIELCGLVSNICVLSNAVMAKSACPNSEIIVDSSLTAAADEEIHQKSLDVMKGLFIKVL